MHFTTKGKGKTLSPKTSFIVLHVLLCLSHLIFFPDAFSRFLFWFV